MKKLITVATLCFLTACVYAGDVNFMPSRNKVFSFWNTTKIRFYDKDTERSLASVQEVTEENVEHGVVQTVQTGGLMASAQTNRTSTYEFEVLKANKKAVLNSTYSPFFIEKDKFYRPFGEVKINDEAYMLVKQKNNGDILIVAGDGQIYNHIGRMVDGRLAILRSDIFIEPENVRLSPAVETVTDVENNVGGFELYYAGLEDDEMTFSYSTLGPDGETETYSFPVDERFVEIEDLAFEVLEVDYNNITFVLN